MKVGLLVNPGAARGGGKGEELARRLHNHPSVMIRKLERFEALPSHLRDFAAGCIDILAISSGDGTVQAVLTELGERSPFPNPPALLLLRHGTTNMTGKNIGFESNSLSRQSEFLKSPSLDSLQNKPALKCVNLANRLPQHGMFLGAGAIPVAARYCHAVLNRRGFGGDIAPGLTLAAALATSAFGRGTRIDQPHDMTLTLDRITRAHGPQLLLLATTLDRLILKSRPFWGAGAGPIDLTLLPHPFPGKLRWLWPLLYGGPARAAPPGAKSFRTAAFSLATTSELLLDGEYIQPPRREPLQVETGVTLNYIRGP